MNPLCPRCHATLTSSILSDVLTCPDCDYTHGSFLSGSDSVLTDDSKDDDEVPYLL